ncbi:hypothetical protein ABBQ38_004583 [Trebouxia sp. C0009 RCD-2024]
MGVEELEEVWVWAAWLPADSVLWLVSVHLVLSSKASDHDQAYSKAWVEEDTSEDWLGLAQDFSFATLKLESIATLTSTATCETEKAKFEESLRTAEEEIRAISAKHDKLAAELATRDSALSACQTRNQRLLEELVSYRAESFELRGTTAAFREQYEAQARRAADLYGRFRSLAHHSMHQEATINALREEVEMLKNGWVMCQLCAEWLLNLCPLVSACNPFASTNCLQGSLTHWPLTVG